MKGGIWTAATILVSAAAGVTVSFFLDSVAEDIVMILKAVAGAQ